MSNREETATVFMQHTVHAISSETPHSFNEEINDFLEELHSNPLCDTETIQVQFQSNMAFDSEDEMTVFYAGMVTWYEFDEPDEEDEEEETEKPARKGRRRNKGRRKNKR